MTSHKSQNFVHTDKNEEEMIPVPDTKSRQSKLNISCYQKSLKNVLYWSRKTLLNSFVQYW